MKKLLIGALASLAISTGVQAQTTPEADSAAAAEAALQHKIDMLKLEVDLKKLQNDLVASQMDALGFKAVEGKTELGQGAGKLEGVMLASRAVEKAAEVIVSKLPDGTEPVALLLSTDQIDFSAGIALSREMAAIDAASTGLVKQYCPSRAADGVEVLAAPLPLIGAALSLLRTDTKIDGFTMSNVDRALVDAIAGRSGRTWVFLDEVNAADENNEIVKAFDKLLTRREILRLCHVDVEAKATTEAAKKAAAPKLATLDAMAKRIDAFAVRVSAPRDSGSNELTAAIKGSKIGDKHKNLLGLRVSVNEAGGSVLKRSNFFTALGAPAVGITGGLVVSWRLFDPRDGSVKKAGILVCRTALTNLNAIHKGSARGPSCDWNLPAPTTEGRAG